MTRTLRRSIALCLLPLLVCAACGDPSTAPVVAKRPFDAFRNDVYPVLLRDCGFPACHGDPKRFFRVWGPGRARLPLESTMIAPEALDQPTGQEIAVSLALALSMIDERDLAHSPLLRKPLAVSAGGSGHMGIDNFGRDVYRTTSDQGYQVLQKWVFSPAPAPAPAR